MAVGKLDSIEGLSADTQSLLDQLGTSAHATRNDELEDEQKIFYCSRTHSQLSQFVNELRRIKLEPNVAAGIDPKEFDSLHKTEDTMQEGLRHLALGSRKNLCINPKVASLSSMAAINERCLELQKSGTSTEHKCSFLPSKENESLVHGFRDYALAEIRDIEDLGKLGKKIGICPYYASRSAIKPSEVDISKEFPQALRL